MGRETEELVEQVKETISGHGLAGAENPVLLMVSGGSDSTALAYMAHKLSKEGVIGPLALLHVHHHLRGEEADADQAFVAHLAQKLGIPFVLCDIDVAAVAERAHDNIEAVARRERYLAANEALESFCLKQAAPLSEGRIFTAHTQDDRVENFYMRSIVGTGPGGFRSMLYRNGPVVRPFLDVSRDGLRAYLNSREAEDAVAVRDGDGALWREDATNAHTDRFRAFVRHEIVARAKERNPQILDTLCRTMNLIADEDDLLDTLARDRAAQCVHWNDQGEGGVPDSSAGCLLSPQLAEDPVALQRRVCLGVLQRMLGADARIETASVEKVLAGLREQDTGSGYTSNIQGDLAVSANKRGVRIEPMAAYRSRRNRA